ncbi:MAG: GNAT family protein [Planctomycetota bacterium]
MSIVAGHVNVELRIRLFTAADSSVIVDWVRSDSELHWLAPSLDPPLTDAKVLSWLKPNGSAFIAESDSSDGPIAYGELNPMSADPGHLWLGHCLVRPDQRGLGIGREFVRVLLRDAFEHQSAHRVSLVVFPGNHSAIHCYLSVGFTFAGEEFHHFRRNHRERLLRLEAKPPRPSVAAVVRSKCDEIVLNYPAQGVEAESELSSRFSGSTATAANTPSRMPLRICETPL